MLTRNPHFDRIAALAEILMVLVAGNLVGLALYQIISPRVPATPGWEAALEGVLILLRLGSAAVIGYALLYYRRKITPRQAGMTRNGKPVGELIRIGLALGVFTTVPIALLFAAHALVPFGTGLPAWWTYPEQKIDAVFWIGFLGTSVLIPPLVEEILTRGYQRHRLVEAYGVMGGVVLTGLTFAFAHSRYLAPDPMLLLFLLCLVISSVSWTYVAQKTGSVLPPMVAHAFTNGVATLILFDVWLPMFALIVAVAALRHHIRATLVALVRDWREDSNRASIWTGLLALLVLLAPGLLLLPIVGRLPVLFGIGAVALILTLLNLYAERMGKQAYRG